MLLEFFLPIGQSLDKLEKVDTGYSASPACRLNYDFEACLAGGQIGKAGLMLWAMVLFLLSLSVVSAMTLICCLVGMGFVRLAMDG